MILKLGTTARNLILMPLGGATGAYLRTAIWGFCAPYTPHSKPIVDFEGFWRIFEEKQWENTRNRVRNIGNDVKPLKINPEPQ